MRTQLVTAASRRKSSSICQARCGSTGRSGSACRETARRTGIRSFSPGAERVDRDRHRPPQPPPQRDNQSRRQQEQADNPFHSAPNLCPYQITVRTSRAHTAPSTSPSNGCRRIARQIRRLPPFQRRAVRRPLVRILSCANMPWRPRPVSGGVAMSQELSESSGVVGVHVHDFPEKERHD